MQYKLGASRSRRAPKPALNPGGLSHHKEKCASLSRLLTRRLAWLQQLNRWHHPSCLFSFLYSHRSTVSFPDSKSAPVLHFTFFLISPPAYILPRFLQQSFSKTYNAPSHTRIPPLPAYKKHNSLPFFSSTLRPSLLL